MGLLPLISENGARTIGAIANPMQKIVIPRSHTTGLTFHQGLNTGVAGAYSPAE